MSLDNSLGVTRIIPVTVDRSPGAKGAYLKAVRNDLAGLSRRRSPSSVLRHSLKNASTGACVLGGLG